MKNKWNSLLFGLLTMFSSPHVIAQNVTTTQKLVINMTNGWEDVSLYLRDDPKITFFDEYYRNHGRYFDQPSLFDMMMITTKDGNNIELPTSWCIRMTVEKVEETTIKQINADKSTFFSWQSDALIVNVSQAGAQLSINSLDGKSYLSKSLPSGRYALPLSDLPKGVYIITVNSKTIKISK